MKEAADRNCRIAVSVILRLILLVLPDSKSLSTFVFLSFLLVKALLSCFKTQQIFELWKAIKPIRSKLADEAFKRCRLLVRLNPN